MTSARTLSDWLVTPQGQYVMMREQAVFDRSVADIFGFNAVQLGLPQHHLLRSSRIPLHILAGKEPGVKLWLETVELPFETGSIDLVLLPHVLEFNQHPHEILREVERVLQPEGSVIISGFNPLSLWGLRRALGSKEGYPWCGNFISVQRMKDWMALLGFEVDAAHYACYAPPFNGSTLLTRAQSLEPVKERNLAAIGGIYVLQAKKRVPGMRLIKPKWNGRLVRNLLPASAKLNKEGHSQTSEVTHWKAHKQNNE